MSEEAIKKLRWACRRGMLELDVLLLPFLENVYSDLSSQDQAVFCQLLDCADQDLFDWLTAKLPVSQPQFVEMVASIRHYAQHRSRA